MAHLCLNAMGTSSGKGITPWELWNGSEFLFYMEGFSVLHEFGDDGLCAGS